MITGSDARAQPWPEGKSKGYSIKVCPKDRGRVERESRDYLFCDLKIYKLSTNNTRRQQTATAAAAATLVLRTAAAFF